MKRFCKFMTICAVLTTSLFISSPSTVSAADSWPGFQNVTIGMTFGKLGLASFYTSVIPSTSSYYSTINMKLQRYSNGKWNTLTSGTYGHKGLNVYSRSYYVTKGYTYRVHSVITIYKSKGGKKINSDTFNYKSKYK